MYSRLNIVSHQKLMISPVVSTAFQILSDADKRAHFDRYGVEDERNFASASRPSANFHRGGGEAFGTGPELSPEDLFNMFFGGGGGRQSGFNAQFGGPAMFGNGQGFRTFSFGGPGMQARARQQQAGGGGNDSPTVWLQLLPLVMLLFFAFSSHLVNFVFPPTVDPTYTFDATVNHPIHRQTNNLKADY